MKFAHRVASLLCTLAILIVGTYTVIAYAIAFFIVTGKLEPGEEMYVDILTPAIASTLLFILVGTALTAGLGFARHKLSSRFRP